MMCVMIRTNTGFVRENVWHTSDALGIGDSNSNRLSARFGMDANCIEIQADGDELHLICKRFTNIPCGPGPVVRWKGEIARFIYDNL
jgi:hypothetical protein